MGLLRWKHGGGGSSGGASVLSAYGELRFFNVGAPLIANAPGAGTFVPVVGAGFVLGSVLNFSTPGPGIIGYTGPNRVFDCSYSFSAFTAGFSTSTQYALLDGSGSPLPVTQKPAALGSSVTANWTTGISHRCQLTLANGATLRAGIASFGGAVSASFTMLNIFLRNLD